MDALAHGKRKYIDLGRSWHWMSIEREHGKAMTREMEVNIPQASCMNEVESYALAGLYADCVTSAERLVTNRKEDFLIAVDGREGCGAHRRGSCGACG
jgi:hypothetical protein